MDSQIYEDIDQKICAERRNIALIIKKRSSTSATQEKNYNALFLNLETWLQKNI